MSRRAQVKREAQERLTEMLAERDAQRELQQRLRDMTIVERTGRSRVTRVERPLPYGALPASAAETPGFVVDARRSHDIHDSPAPGDWS